MAILSLNYCSTELKMHTVIKMAIPDSAYMKGKSLSDMKVLWLLHGLSDDASAWTRFTRVENYITDKNLILIMPSVGRSMYCDNVLGQNYFTHIAQELPEYLKSVFNLPQGRDKNFVAGLSMGGLGAAKLALSYPDRYKAFASLSGILDFAPLLAARTTEIENDFPFLFKHEAVIATSPLNPVALLTPKIKQSGLKIYVACGLQDDLLLTNYSFKKRSDELNLNAEYVFEDGAHTWDFWDRHIKAFIEKYAAD